MIRTLALTILLLSSQSLFAQQAFEIFGKKTSIEDLKKEDQSVFFDADMKYYEQIEQLAYDRYLEEYWKKMAMGKPVEAFQSEFFAKKAKVSKKEIDNTLKEFKDHPQLSQFPEAEQRKQIESYLKERKAQEVVQGLIDTAIEKGELAINFPKPKLVIALSDRDPVRYGPDPGHTKPMGCKGDECPITVVEYSEFQCGFCAKVQPTIKKLLAKYKGKIRWIARDYPLPNHPRARPAAIAAHCAGNQGKYWFMYEKLFENQRALADTDFSRYAKEIGLNTEEYEKCYSSSEEVKALVETNVKSGGKLGVSGTPAIFINGQRISGAVPFEQFERTIESELKSAKKS